MKTPLRGTLETHSPGASTGILAGPLRVNAVLSLGQRLPSLATHVSSRWGSCWTLQVPSVPQRCFPQTPEGNLKSGQGLEGDLTHSRALHLLSPQNLCLQHRFLSGSHIIHSHQVAHGLRASPLSQHSLLAPANKAFLMEWSQQLYCTLSPLTMPHWGLSPFHTPETTWQFQQFPMRPGDLSLISLDLSVTFNILIKTMVIKTHTILFSEILHCPGFPLLFSQLASAPFKLPVLRTQSLAFSLTIYSLGSSLTQPDGLNATCMPTAPSGTEVSTEAQSHIPNQLLNS